MPPKILAVTGGNAATPLSSALPQLLDVFAGFQGQSIRMLNADVENTSLHESFDCDRISARPTVELGAKIINACRETDWVIIDIGDLKNAHHLAEFLSATREAAVSQGRSALAYLPVAFGGPPPVIIQMPQEEIGVLGLSGFKVRPALFADRKRRKGHIDCAATRSLVAYGSVPPLGKGLAELVQRHGPTLGRFLARTPSGFAFAANHIRAWLNDCIDGRVFDDVIAVDRLVPGTDQFCWEHRVRKMLHYKFDVVQTMYDAHDDELFKQYHPHWDSKRDILTNPNL